MDELEKIDDKLNKINYENESDTKFYRYDRQILAEVVLERESNYMRTSTYLDFRKRYDALNSEITPLLNSAREFILRLNEKNVSRIMDHLLNIATRLDQETGIKTSITKYASQYMNTSRTVKDQNS